MYLIYTIRVSKDISDLGGVRLSCIVAARSDQTKEKFIFHDFSFLFSNSKKKRKRNILWKKSNYKNLPKILLSRTKDDEDAAVSIIIAWHKNHYFLWKLIRTRKWLNTEKYWAKTNFFRMVAQSATRSSINEGFFCWLKQAQFAMTPK